MMDMRASATQPFAQHPFLADQMQQQQRQQYQSQQQQVVLLPRNVGPCPLGNTGGRAPGPAHTGGPPMACGCESSQMGPSHPLHADTAIPAKGETVHVFDPINRLPYSLNFAGMNAINKNEHSEVIPTIGLSTYFVARAGATNKRFFLCKQYQNNRCRAYFNCNSIHACRSRIAELRTQNPPTKEALEADIQLTVFSEVDGEAFTVALDKTEATVGRDRLRAAAVAKTSLSGNLCKNYPYQCTSPMCPNIHVDVNHMKHIRDMWRLPCCGDGSCVGPVIASTLIYPQLRHQELAGFILLDPNSKYQGSSASVQTPSSLSLSAGGKAYPKSCITPTKGLRDLCVKASESDSHVVDVPGEGFYLKVQQGKLCRPHQKKSCKWGADCNNLHICRLKFAVDANSQWTVSASSSEYTTTPMTSPRMGVCNVANSAGSIRSLTHSPATSIHSSPRHSPTGSPRGSASIPPHLPPRPVHPIETLPLPPPANPTHHPAPSLVACVPTGGFSVNSASAAVVPAADASICSAFAAADDDLTILAARTDSKVIAGEGLLPLLSSFQTCAMPAGGVNFSAPKSPGDHKDGKQHSEAAHTPPAHHNQQQQDADVASKPDRYVAPGTDDLDRIRAALVQQQQQQQQHPPIIPVAMSGFSATKFVDPRA